MGSVDSIYWNILPCFFNTVTVIFIILSLDNTRVFETYYNSPDPTNPLTPSWSQQYGAFEICRSYSTPTASVGSCFDQSAGQCDFKVFDPVAATPVQFSISPCSGWNAYRAFSILAAISSGLSVACLSYFAFARLSSPDRTSIRWSRCAAGFSFFSAISGMIAMAIVLGVFVGSGDTLLWGLKLAIAGWVIAFAAGLFNLVLILKEQKSGRRHIGERENIAGVGIPAVIISEPNTADITIIAPTNTAGDIITPDNTAPTVATATTSKPDPTHLGPLPGVPAHHKSRSGNVSFNASPSQTPGVMIHLDDGQELQPYEPKTSSDDKN